MIKLFAALYLALHLIGSTLSKIIECLYLDRYKRCNGRYEDIACHLLE